MTKTDEGVFAVTLTGGETIDVNITDIDRNEWREACQAWGQGTPKALMDAIMGMDPDALAAVIWIFARRENPSIGYADINFRFGDIVNGLQSNPEKG